MQKKYNICNEKIQCDLCKSNDICKAWTHFVNNHKDIKSYAHFDLGVSLRNQSVREYVMSEIKVKQHSFYPFIHFEKSKNKFNRNIKPVSKKYRDIYYCSHLDRCVYQRYAFLINYSYNIYMKDKSLSNVAIAYRDELNKSNINFAKEVFDNIKLHDKCFIMVGDFKSFFDNIDHNYLKKMLCTVMETERLPDDYFLGFIFDGTDVKIRPKSITKYYYRMRRKARTIGRCNWKTRTGKHITVKKLYSIYSDDNRSGKKQTFIGYVKKSKKVMGLNDKESDALLKRHKHKIANTIRKAEQEMLENKLREAESDRG